MEIEDIVELLMNSYKKGFEDAIKALEGAFHSIDVEKYKKDFIEKVRINP